MDTKPKPLLHNAPTLIKGGVGGTARTLFFDRLAYIIPVVLRNCPQYAGARSKV